MSITIKIVDMDYYQTLENRLIDGDNEADSLINLLEAKVYQNGELQMEGTFSECSQYLHDQF